MELNEKILALGLTENKVKETMKNENLTKILTDISDKVS